jgi:hypothetical protein
LDHRDRAYISYSSDPSDPSFARCLTLSYQVTHGVELAPPTAEQSAAPGTTVTFTLQVTNTSNAMDTFDVSVAGNTWTTTAPATVGPLAWGGSTTFDVAVDVPSDAVGGASDTAIVTVTSQGDSTESATASLTAKVPAQGLFLPLVMREMGGE